MPSLMLPSTSQTLLGDDLEGRSSETLQVYAICGSLLPKGQGQGPAPQAWAALSLALPSKGGSIIVAGRTLPTLCQPPNPSTMLLNN